MIANKWIDAENSKEGMIYYPELTYSVIGNGGQRIASDSSGMGLETSGTQSDVQSELNQYQVGLSYTCWYSPIASPGAMIMQPDLAASRSAESVIWSICTFVALLLIGWCAKHMIFYPRGLYRRTVKTSGKVIKYEKRHSRSGSYTVSIVEFQTKTKPALTCRTEASGSRRLDSSVNLCYDWLNPAKNRKVETRYERSSMKFAVVSGSILISLITCASLWFFIWVVFQFAFS